MSALRTHETAKAVYLLAYARGMSHRDAAAAAGASRRSFYDARVRDREFGRACEAVYAVRLAQEYSTRAELVEALREAASGLAAAADRLEESSRVWFTLQSGVVDFLERLDARLDSRGELPNVDVSPRALAAALDALDLSAAG